MQNTSSIHMFRAAAFAALVILTAPAAHAGAAPAAATEMTTVPGLARTLMPGDIITASDIAWVSVPARQVTQTMITDQDSLIGLAVRRPMGANTPVRFSDVQRPVLVKRGALVTMIVKTPTMTLSATGRAQENGGQGDQIRLTNTASNLTVQGTVLSAREVVITVGSRVADLGQSQ